MDRLSEDRDRKKADGRIRPDPAAATAPAVSCRGLCLRGTASSSAERVSDDTGLGAVARYGRRAGLMLAIRSRLSGVLAARRVDCSVGVALLAGGRFFFLRTPSVSC